jgi:bifunctional DNase/RNase
MDVGPSLVANGEVQMALVECELARVVMSETQDRQFVVLKEKDGERRMAIVIGPYEVFAIHRVINDQPTPRPLTHELLSSVLDALGVKIEKVVICDLRSSTFYGRLILTRDGETYDLDSRPSDAIVLAVHKGAPIFVEEAVLEESTKTAWRPPT